MPDLRSAPYVHNEFLNIWTDLGVAGVAVFLWIIISYYKRTINLIRAEKRWPLAGFLAGSTGILTQSLVEFNLHVPALALILMVMIGISVSFAQEKKGPLTEIKPARKAAWLVPVWAIVILCSGILIMPIMAENQMTQGDRAFENLNYVSALEHYELALKYNPLSAEIMDKAARNFYREGVILKDEIFIWAAGHYLEKAVRLEPLNPFRHRELALRLLHHRHQCLQGKLWRPTRRYWNWRPTWKLLKRNMLP